MADLFNFITYSDAHIMGEILSNESTGIMHISFPIKIELITITSLSGFFTQHIPSLYQPFGNHGVIPFHANMFASITKCSDGDIRYYEHTLAALVYQESKRRLMLDSFFNQKEYDHYIFDAPEILQ